MAIQKKKKNIDVIVQKIMEFIFFLSFFFLSREIIIYLNKKKIKNYLIEKEINNVNR